jgi:hypothetical protein
MAHYLPLTAPTNPFTRRWSDAFPLHAVDQLPSTVNLAAWLGPLRNQNIPGFGECSGESGAGAVDWLSRRWRHDPFFGSSLWTYELERYLANQLTQDTGATLEQTQAVLQQWGVCSNALDPDTKADFLRQITPAMRQSAAAHRIADGLWCPTLDEVINALAQSTRPTVVQLGIVVYPSFEAAETMQSGMVPLPQPGEQPLGGHAVLAFGYDRAAQILYVRNSWGPCYGTEIGGPGHGNFALPWAYLRNPTWFLDARAYYLEAV